MTAVAIVEPHHLTRARIARAIATNPELKVVAAVASPAELGEVDAGVVLLSSRACRPKLGPAVGVLRRSAGVVIMADTPGRADLLAALRAGAGGFIASDAAQAELLAAIDAVGRGACYLMAGVVSYLHGGPDCTPGPDAKVLTRREIETLRLVASGYTHGQVARRLGLTVTTVNTYVKRIRAKLNVGNKAGLTRRAIELGYLSEASGPGHRPAVHDADPGTVPGPIGLTRLSPRRLSCGRRPPDKSPG